MLEFYERRKFKRFLYSPLTVGLLCIPLYVLSNAAWNAYAKEREAAHLRSEVVRELAEVRERESYLTAELDRATSERGIEQEMRQKFDVGKEGEEIIVLVGRNNTPTKTASTSDEVQSERGSGVLRTLGF